MERASDRVREGQLLYSADGHRMGRIVRRAPDELEVEHGFFFPKDFLVRDDELLEVAGERVTARLSRSELLQEWRRSYLLGDAKRPPPREPPRPP